MKTLEKNSSFGFNKVALVELNMQQLTDANSGRDARYRDDIIICWTFSKPTTDTIIYSCFCVDPQNG